MTSKSGSGAGQSGSAGKKTAAERSPVQVGDVIADKYRVEKIVAAGGMGVVVAARHVQLGQIYAVKLLLPDAQHESAVERFLREARAAARIESTHVCRVFDCGAFRSDIPYMVMEHLTGHDLATELKGRGRLPVLETVDILLQALEGIAEAHAVGIVHRDLKPSNLFLCQKAGRAREVKVLDFGISKLAPGLEQNAEDDLTATATMLGSPRYMSPEQIESARHVDHRTDIWSLGVILYQMLEGKTPFAGTTMGETIGKVLLHAPPPIREVRPDVPEGIALVLERCLQRDREKRYRNVAELALALAPFASGASQPSIQRITALLVQGQLGAGGVPAPMPQPPERPRNAPDGSRGDEPSLGTVGPVTHGARPSASKRAGFWVGLGLAALATVGVALVLLAGLGAERAPAAAPGPAVPSAAETSRPEPVATRAPAPVESAAPPASASASSAPTTSAAPSATSKPRVKPTARPGKSKDSDLLNDSY